jgi:hypothetical protein
VDQAQASALEQKNKKNKRLLGRKTDGKNP